MEIVTEPDIRSAEEAAAFVRELRLILLKLGTCTCKMQGQLYSVTRFLLPVHRWYRHIYSGT